MRSSIGKVTAIVVAMAGHAATANAQTTLTDLGPGPAIAINNSGQVLFPDRFETSGVPTSIGMTGYAINDAGHVAGALANHIGLYTGTLPPTDLGVITGADPTFQSANGTAINANDDVVGIGGKSGNVVSFFYDNSAGTKTTLSGLPGQLITTNWITEAYGINDSGLVTGRTLKDTGELGLVSFLYDAPTATWTEIAPGAGYAINAAGQVTGVLSASLKDTRPTMKGSAFIYDNGVITNLGTLGGTLAAGYAINADGVVVGTSELAGSTDKHAFFSNGAMSDLNTFVSASDPLKSRVTLIEARGVTDTRLILVNGFDSVTNSTHAYLLQAPWSDVSPGRLSFPSQAVGTESATQAITLKNSGAVAMALGTTTIAGDFTQTNDCGTTLAPGATCTANVAFKPTVGADSTGVLTFVTDGYPVTAHLAGVSPLIVSMTASSSTPLVGAPVTISWTSASSAQCSVPDGSSDNGWFGSKTASGSKVVTQTAPGTAVYKLECTAGGQTASGSVSVTASWPVPTASITASPTTITAGGLSAQAAANVMDNAPVAESKSGGGGGGMDLLSVLFLFSASAAGLLRHRATLSRRRV